MCLEISKNKRSITPPFKGKAVIAYKVVSYQHLSGKLVAPFHSEHTYKPGWNKSDRPSKELAPEEGFFVSQGIHVLLSESAAKKFVIGQASWVIVKVKGLRKDFVARGKGSSSYAVFTRVFVSKPAYKDAQKRGDFQLRNRW